MSEWDKTSTPPFGCGLYLASFLILAAVCIAFAWAVVLIASRFLTHGL